MVTRDLAGGSGASPDHDAGVGYSKPPELHEPISPELALVDPELAALARALLPAVPGWPRPEHTEETAGPVPVAAAERPAGGHRRRNSALVLVAAVGCALGVSLIGGAVAPTVAGNRSVGLRRPVEPAAGVAAAEHSSKDNARRDHSAGDAPATPASVPTPALRALARKRTTSTPAHAASKHLTAHVPATKRKVTLAKTTSAPREHVLRWRGSAPYFDLVLWRDGKRILDSWPSEPRLQLPDTWTYAGRRYKLTPGTYLWFAYPGIGQRARSSYGPLAASGSLTIG